MEHGVAERCARFHRLDEELELKLLQPLADLAGIRTALQQTEAETTALTNMTTVARSELTTVDARVPATEDVLEHCVRGIGDIKRALLALSTQLDNTRRFVGSVAHAHHDSIMPWLSKEEVECIKGMNPFVPRASD